MKEICSWEKIDDFQSYSEFIKFVAWIESHLVENLALEVPVKSRYAGAGFIERWFQCKATNHVWRLVYPDGPFHGLWDEVAND